MILGGDNVSLARSTVLIALGNAIFGDVAMLGRITSVALALTLCFGAPSFAQGIVDTDALGLEIYRNYDLFQDGKLNGLDYLRMGLRKRNDFVAKAVGYVVAKDFEVNGDYLEVDYDTAAFLADMSNEIRPMLDKFYAGGRNSRVGLLVKVAQLRKIVGKKIFNRHWGSSG